MRAASVVPSFNGINVCSMTRRCVENSSQSYYLRRLLTRFLNQNKARLLYGGSSGSGSSRDELLAAVDVVRRARECRVAHDVNGQRGDVSRSDDAPDGQRRAELVAPLVEVVAEEGCREGSVNESCGDQV